MNHARWRTIRKGTTPVTDTRKRNSDSDWRVGDGMEKGRLQLGCVLCTTANLWLAGSVLCSGRDPEMYKMRTSCRLNLSAATISGHNVPRTTKRVWRFRSVRAVPGWGIGMFYGQAQTMKARLLGQASSDDNPGRAPPSQNPNQVCNKDVSGLVKQ